jgi:hypothetical protein
MRFEAIHRVFAGLDGAVFLDRFIARRGGLEQ